MKYEKLALIPGDSLYPDHSTLEPGEDTLFFMAEDKELCTHYKYHKHKLVLFLSAMRSHADKINEDYRVKYFRLDDDDHKGDYLSNLKDTIEKHDVKQIVSYTIEDKFFREKIERFAKENEIGLRMVESPGFMNPLEDFSQYLEEVKGPYMQNYYIRQRKKHKLLLTKNGKAQHGKWSFDKENRKKLPEDKNIPERPDFKTTGHTTNVKKLVDKMFSDHPGKTDDFPYATTREGALKELDSFLKQRFEYFGPYQDSISRKNDFLFHSILSPYLNSGLLTPSEIVQKAIKTGEKNKVHFPSIEGFIRQIAGWREFMRGMYNNFDLEGNFFNHKNKLTKAWYDGSTGITPLDDVIQKVNKNAYAHHIERLMILGNIMLLSELHPDEVYRWFMEMFIDSADWVMVPNVYGMSQFADGGTFATKPYIAGSNYIFKMSDYKKEEWSDILDGLYWRFIDRKRDFLKSNARMGIMVKSFDKMDMEKKKKILKKADEFIKQTTG